MRDQRPSVLFLCTGNSARSIMAEAIANQVFGDRIRAVSAGARPKQRPHALTLRTLEKKGLSTDGLTSKNWDRFMDDPFDIVITLCDSAAEEQCPTFPGPPDREHWSLPDPPASDHPEDTFEAVYDALNEAIGMLVHTPDSNILGRAREPRKHVNHLFTPRVI